ncbi:MAG: type II toxin-antitoxin system RelE/ParE family toxin [Anaerolineae bacterium]
MRGLDVAHAGRRFIVLHGYRKRSQKAPRREIETARRRLQDFLSRGG